MMVAGIFPSAYNDREEMCEKVPGNCIPGEEESSCEKGGCQEGR